MRSRYIITTSSDERQLYTVLGLRSDGTTSPGTFAARFTQAEASSENTAVILPFEGLENIYVAWLSEEELEKIRQVPTLLSVSADEEVRKFSAKADLTPELDMLLVPTWNAKLIHADGVWARTTGRSVKVAVIDTGIDDDHPFLSVHGGETFVPNTTTWNDDEGHGTHVAGIVGGRRLLGSIGCAPDAELYAVKVLDSTGSGLTSWVIAGIGWAVSHGMQICNLSLGSTVTSAAAPWNPAFEAAGAQAMASGALMIAAAGNSGATAKPWVCNPARCPSFLAVGSVSRSLVRSPFSSFGSSLGPLTQVELVAAGERIESTLMGGSTGTMSGTSMASPHVASAAALLLQQHPAWAPSKLREHLKQTASDLGVGGADEEYGAGLVDCERAVFPYGV